MKPVKCYRSLFQQTNWNWHQCKGRRHRWMKWCSGKRYLSWNCFVSVDLTQDNFSEVWQVVLLWFCFSPREQEEVNDTNAEHRRRPAGAVGVALCVTLERAGREGYCCSLSSMSSTCSWFLSPSPEIKCERMSLEHQTHQSNLQLFWCFSSAFTQVTNTLTKTHR